MRVLLSTVKMTIIMAFFFCVFFLFGSLVEALLLFFRDYRGLVFGYPYTFGCT